MKYLLMIYGNQEKWESFPAEEWPAAIARQEAFNARYRATGELLGAYGLADAVSAKLVRRSDGLPVVTDGPTWRPRSTSRASGCWTARARSAPSRSRRTCRSPIPSRWSYGPSCTSPPPADERDSVLVVPKHSWLHLQGLTKRVCPVAPLPTPHIL